MKFMLLLTYMLAQPTTDGGVAIHTQTVGFSTMARCEMAAARIQAASGKAWLEDRARTRVLVSTICIEAY